MVPEDYNIYNFLVDIVIPIGIFIIGLIVERKWKVTEKFSQIRDESKTKQSQDIIGSSNQSFQARDVYVSYRDNSSEDGTREPRGQLPYKENQFVERVVKILKTKKIRSTFADCYKDGYMHTINRCSSLAASSYLSAFLQVKGIFLTKANYRREVNADFVKTLEDNLNILQKFSDESVDNIEELKKIISSIENIMIRLFAYFIL